MKYLFCLALSIFFCNPAMAAWVRGVPTTITGISSYTDGTLTGDVKILVATPVSGCEAGYYIPGNVEAKKEAISIALSAFHANSTVQINGFDGRRWVGSPQSHFCIIESIHLTK